MGNHLAQMLLKSRILGYLPAKTALDDFHHHPDLCGGYFSFHQFPALLSPYQ
jgi:hypothetical protein